MLSSVCWQPLGNMLRQGSRNKEIWKWHFWRLIFYMYRRETINWDYGIIHSQHQFSTCSNLFIFHWTRLQSIAYFLIHQKTLKMEIVEVRNGGVFYRCTINQCLFFFFAPAFQLCDFVAQLVRALHRHRRGHGFKSRWVTWIFQVHETIA